MTSSTFLKQAVLCCALAAAASAWADGRLMPAQVLPVYKQECAACHMAYPPGMLPAASWQRIMSGLETHYGSDASLEPAQVQQVAAWLQAHAGTYKRVREEPPQDRITQSAWFERWLPVPLILFTCAVAPLCVASIVTLCNAVGVVVLST